MIYSYIKPRDKSLITNELKLLFIFFSITILMLLLTFLFLSYKNYSFTQNTKDIQIQKHDLNISLHDMDAQIEYIEKQESLSEKIFTKNTVLKDSITNMFDLVPERITLSEAKLLKNGLILYGITPNKDIYNFMLQAPLRSIFHRTYSSFYPADNGWLFFVSKNYIDTDDYNLDTGDKDED
ncbi:MAG: hypothetical protein U9N02_07600 [Campylobacterota bacterium]|nr:hypothetical protein [Campylobacterota bacterium]